MTRGDRSALAELYDRHAAALMRVALRFLPERQDAEDLLHDVFVEAWGRAADYDPDRGSVRRWLLMRTRSRAIDRVRALQTAQRYARAEAASACEASAPRAGWDARDRERARRALNQLPSAQRALIELLYFDGLTCAEAARRCGIPIGTIKSRLSAALSKLRSSFHAPAGNLQ